MVSAGFARAATHDEPVRVTVQQLQQFLEDQQAEHVSDSDLAQKLAGAELSEQLTELKLARLKTELKLGEETTTELNLLADLSAFLGPPAAESPAEGPPDAAAQKEIISAAQNFAVVTLRRLPDFLATRTSHSFEDRPIEIAGRPVQSGMHPVGTLVQEVAYRNGMEALSRSFCRAEHWRRAKGVASRHELGRRVWAGFDDCLGRLGPRNHRMESLGAGSGRNGCGVSL